jgi:tetratricopeptide (TPR) repeat protein
VGALAAVERSYGKGESAVVPAGTRADELSRWAQRAAESLQALVDQGEQSTKTLTEEFDRLKRDQEAQMSFFQADQALDDADYAGALTQIEEALSSQPDSGNLWALKALALAKRGDRQAAEAAAGEAIRNNADAFQLARGYAALQDQERALSYLRAAVDAANDDRVLGLWMGMETNEEFSWLAENSEFQALLRSVRQSADDWRSAHPVRTRQQPPTGARVVAGATASSDDGQGG